jgi:hypothetical protein
MDFIRDEEFERRERELLKLVTDATDFRRSQRDSEYITNMAHYEGLHWNLAENKVDSPFLLRSDINHLKDAVDIRLGSLCSEKYWGELKPLSPNDVQHVEDLNVLYKNEWNRLSADDYVEYVIKYGAICDNGYVFINYDPSKIVGGTGYKREGAITLEQLETSNVYLDPTASNIDECEYIVVKSKKSKMWIKRNKPQWLKIFEDLNIKPSDNGMSNENGDIYVGRDYARASSGQYELYTMYRKEVFEKDMDTTDGEGKVIASEKVRGLQIKEYFFVGRHLIDINERYPFDEFPVITFQWQPEPQSPYGVPLLRGLTVPQKVANLIESAANNIAMHYTVPTWLVSSESGIDIEEFAKLSNALGMAWKVDGDVSKAVKQMDPPQINADLIGIKESFVNNIRMYAGVTDQYVGDIGTAGSTAEGTNRAINRATVIDNSVIKQIEKFVEKLSRMIVKFMARYYKNQDIYIRDTTKETGAYQFRSVNVKEDFGNINYEFYVDLASRSKIDKNRQYNLMKELYTIQNQYKEDKRIINVADLVKAANLDNYNEMYKRFSDMSEEAFAEKADLIVQILQIGQTMTPNGTPLISAEDMQQGIMDVLDDNGDLSLVEGIFNTYEQYETKVTELTNQLAAREMQTTANEYVNAANAQSELVDNLIQGREDIMWNGLPQEDAPRQ